VAALIAQERFTEALALSSESTEETVAPEGHVMLADMIAAIEANCDEASKANFMTNFSQDDLNRCGKSNLAGAIELQNKAREWTRTLFLCNSKQQSRLGQCWLQAILTGTQKLRESIDAAVAMVDQVLMQPDSAEYEWRLNLKDSEKIQTFVNGVCELYRVVLLLEQTDKMHSFCIGLASDKRSRMMQALFAVKPSFAMFRKTMESISVEVPEVELVQDLWQKIPSQVTWGSCCALSLVPFESMPDTPVVEWNGRKYLCPVINMWIHIVTQGSSNSIPI
jgi:hypothetical protein